MKAVLFDLDDTLYPETDFVRSGFDSVATYLHSIYQFDKQKLMMQMLEILKNDGRGKVFNTLLKDLNLYAEERCQLLVYLYRSHLPDIQLYVDVPPVLEYLKDNKIKLGLITDGMASVQKNKISALNLKIFFDTIICTDELGKEYWKPSTIPFKIALEFLGVQPSEAIYVGDNARKDFIAPNALGMRTIQIKRLPHIEALPSTNVATQQAMITIKNFEELVPIIEKERNDF